MWPNMVEFRSASSAGSWRKKRRKKEESLVKYKSADKYMSGGLMIRLGVSAQSTTDRQTELRYRRQLKTMTMRTIDLSQCMYSENSRICIEFSVGQP